MRRNDLLFVRGVVFLATVLILVFAVQLMFSLLGEGFHVTSVTGLTADEARHMNNVFNRNLNQLLGTLFTAVAIGVSLTANMYSFKFLEFFIRDRVNTSVLLLVLVSNASNTFSWGNIETTQRGSKGSIRRQSARSRTTFATTERRQGMLKWSL